MLGIEAAILVDDQPIGGHMAATMLHESRYLTSWFNDEDLEVQAKYKEITDGLPSLESKIIACWQYVKDIPYTQFVSTKVIVAGRAFAEKDTWLDAGQTIQVPSLNCMNKSILLANLLRQELSPDQVYICLNNVRDDGIGGHAVCYLKLDRDYVLETTNPRVATPFMLAEDTDIYEPVVFFNDDQVWRVEGVDLKEPFGMCCVRWLSDYIDPKYCTEWVS